MQWTLNDLYTKSLIALQTTKQSHKLLKWVNSVSSFSLFKITNIFKISSCLCWALMSKLSTNWFYLLRCILDTDGYDEDKHKVQKYINSTFNTDMDKHIEGAIIRHLYYPPQFQCFNQIHHHQILILKHQIHYPLLHVFFAWWNVLLRFPTQIKITGFHRDSLAKFKVKGGRRNVQVDWAPM